jgi:hypothetical protein
MRWAAALPAPNIIAGAKPGLFGTQYDFFRVTNKSGAVWKDVTFTAEALAEEAGSGK